MSRECCDPDHSTRVVAAATPVAATPIRVEDDACCGGSTRKGANGVAEARPPFWRDMELLPSAVSGLALAGGYACAWSDLQTASLALHWVALLAGAWTFIPGALRKLSNGRLGVGLLMTIAAVGAVLLGHVGEAAALAFLFSLAETLEDRAMDRAKEGLRALLSLIPETARVTGPHGDVAVPCAEIERGDILSIGAGERVATDGVVTAGHSSIDTSAVTGESIPVVVAPGDTVPAGAINGSGRLLVRASADGRDNSLTQIVNLVEQAHARKGERARLADRIARPLVPAVLAVSLLVAIVGSLLADPTLWIERALVVLVAASPCALAIAVPVTVISAIGSASRFGVIIKSGQAFEQLGTIRTVAFDKTGTLTRNRPAVSEIRTIKGIAPEELLRLAAAVEAASTHPLATAIASAVPGVSPAGDAREDAGLGVAGMVGTRQVKVGNPRWLDPLSLREEAREITEAGMTAVVVEIDGQAAGVIGIRDELRPEAAETVGMLREQDIDSIMLTGDNSRTAQALATRAGIAQVHAEQLPVDKADVIDTLSRERPTAMIGDGINDAPALATATVGIAMGATGSAAAVESADIAFTGHDLRLIPLALAHARRGRRIMGGEYRPRSHHHRRAVSPCRVRDARFGGRRARPRGSGGRRHPQRPSSGATARAARFTGRSPT